MSDNINNLELLPEFIKAANALADLHDCPTHVVVHEAIMDKLVESHSELLDMKNKYNVSSCDELFDEYEHHLEALNAARKEIYPYEDNVKCICCGKLKYTPSKESHSFS